MPQLQVIYRFSDGGQHDPSGNIQRKGRPSYFDKRTLFSKCLTEFGKNNVFVIADNVSEESYNFLKMEMGDGSRIERTNLKSGALSFLHAVDLVISRINDPEQIVYFCEDDYIHKEGCSKALADAFNVDGVHYATGYDHPDKYLHPNSGGNPYVQHNGEVSKICVGKLSHWKTTNSTTMTFACKVKTVCEDYDVYRKYCHTGYPHDFEMFLDLCRNRKRILVSSIPAQSTHCELGVLAPLVNWEVIA